MLSDGMLSKTECVKPQPLWFSLQSFRWQVKETVPIIRGAPRKDGRITATEKIVVENFQTDELNDSQEELDNQGQDEGFVSPKERFSASTDYNQEDELPPLSITGKMRSIFKSMENINGAAPPTPETHQKKQHLLRTTSMKASPTRHFTTTGEEHVNGHTESESHSEGYEMTPDGGEYDNEPIRNEDVIRSGEPEPEDDLPEQGTTRSLLAKYRALTT